MPAAVVAEIILIGTVGTIAAAAGLSMYAAQAHVDDGLWQTAVDWCSHHPGGGACDGRHPLVRPDGATCVPQVAGNDLLGCRFVHLRVQPHMVEANP